MLATLPATIMTAMASPMARPMPSTTAAAMPLEAAGTDTRNTVSMWVAPSARDASSYSRGTALRAVSDTLMMEGRIINGQHDDGRKQARSVGQIKQLAHGGNQDDHAHQAVHHGGDAGQQLHRRTHHPGRQAGATLDRKIAVISPTGTPSRMAPAVP